MLNYSSNKTNWFLVILVNLILAGFLFNSCSRQPAISISPSGHDLYFEKLATRWDEAIPLGNGMLGALIWQKGNNLRISLDRADLWDLRPMETLNIPEFRFSWVYDQVNKEDYKPVQDLFDVPYNRNPAPTKIPAGALEFDISQLGEIEYIQLYLNHALCDVKWTNGARLLTFIHATIPVGWYRFENIPADVLPLLVPPPYCAKTNTGNANSVTGQDLRRLGYKKGEILQSDNAIFYKQEGWNGFYYEINTEWEIQKDGTLEGSWSISSQYPDMDKTESASSVVKEAINRGFEKDFISHNDWWLDFRNQSSVTVPDPVLEKQWYLEMYKFGSASRRGAPPISLQAVWTADNGRIPPWKGDFHHDLNTQLSYWPCYSGNHLEEGLAFPDWLWEIRPEAKKYTKAYFGTNGLNVPGVTTLRGQPMGGWIQYSFSPTVSAWLAHHFYLHWRYSMDRNFLQDRAYPFIKDVAIHLEEISVRNKNNQWKLPISSSPEIHNNSIHAWFHQTTNYDLALIRWTFNKAAEMADELDLEDEALHWKEILSGWPGFAVSDSTGGLLVTPGEHLQESHRHFSHLMAIHPLGLIDWDNGEKDREIIKNTINDLDSLGTDWWTGYSFSWLGNLKARAMDGEGAAEVLKIFAECFCLPNSFHVNGDQSGTGKSKFTYRPFTLEGNFAFAAGIQEMLLQSHTGIIYIFPAIPKSWEDVSFEKLRAEGAFLVSAKKTNGKLDEVIIMSEAGGTLKLANPFGEDFFEIAGVDMASDQMQKPVIEIEIKPGMEIIFKRLTTRP
ncbi:MAG: hypothetical protein GH151_03735 [Bacteroidetes bacterium]|nr:hypothetical protein [Bacteroidota bacterium]